MGEEKYIVFERDGEFYEFTQESIRLTKQNAIDFRNEMRKEHPDRFYCIMTELENE